MKNKKVLEAIKTVGEEVMEGVFMVDCGCEVEGTEVSLCPRHKKMSATNAAASIVAPPVVEEAPVSTESQEEQLSIEIPVNEVPTQQPIEEESKMTKPVKVSFKELKEQAVAMGVDIKGLRSIKAVTEAMEAHAASEVAATVVEPVAIEIDNTQAITGYAVDLLKAVSAGVDHNTLAKRASYAAHGILSAQVAEGVELTEAQQAVMAKHGATFIKREQLISFTTVKELTTMSGTQLYILATKLGAKPKLNDIEALRTNLIQYYNKNVVAQPKQQTAKQASAASKANEVSPNNNAKFTSAHAIRVYPNAVQFIANGEQYAFGFNKQGKGVLRKGNNSQYMNVNYLKGLLYPINTKSSRDLVKLLGTIKSTQVGGQA